jgi:hypothetical protein
VCRRWWEITLSLPDLWSSWSLVIDRNIFSSGLGTGVDLWPPRSQSRPLSTIGMMTMASKDGCKGSPDQSSCPKLSITIAVGRALNSMFLLSLVCLRDLAKTIPTQGPPHFTHLLLGSVQTDWGENFDAHLDTKDPITLFANAPHLRSLHLILAELRRPNE